MPSTFEFQNSHFLLHLDFRGLSTYQICCVICCVFGDCIKIEIFLFIMAPVTLIFSLHVIPCSGIDHLINLQTRTWTHINSTMPQVGIDPLAQSHASYEASALPTSHYDRISIKSLILLVPAFIILIYRRKWFIIVWKVNTIDTIFW